MEEEQKTRRGLGYEVNKVRGASPTRDALFFETRNGTTPGTQDLSMFAIGAQQYSVWLGEQCTLDPAKFEYPNENRCLHLYLGVTGTFTVTATTGNLMVGSVAGIVTNVHFREVLVQPNGSFVLGSRCADLPSEDFSGSFP